MSDTTPIDAAAIATLLRDPASVEPTALAAVLREVDDTQLRAALDGGLAAVVLPAVFARFPEFLEGGRVPDDLEAEIEWRVRRGRREHEAWTLRLAGGACHATKGSADDARVVFTLDAADFLRLVTAQANPALLVLSGGLVLEGDVRFAVELAGWFRVPSADGGHARVQTIGVDAAAVAAAIAGVSDRDLGPRVASVRDVLLEEIFRRFPEFVRTDRVAGIDAVVGWKITGRADGGADRWAVRLADGRCTVERDPVERPHATIRCDAAEFLKLVTGNANPAMAFLRGRLGVKGDIGLAAQLPRLFRVPSPQPAAA